jgi:hypothetical protein
MVAGIVLFALGLKTTLADVDRSLATVPALGLCGGVALYLLAHVALRLRMGAGLGRGRPVTVVVLLLLLPLATTLPGLAALGVVAIVCASLVTYEAVRHRDSCVHPKPARRIHDGRGSAHRNRRSDGKRLDPGRAILVTFDHRSGRLMS